MTALTVVSAGVRSPSSTRMLADRISEAVQAELTTHDQHVDLRVIEVRDHAHAIADALLAGFPAGDLRTALDEVTGADALVVVTPTFQASYSGLFKSFIDLIEPDAIRGMPVLLAATGGSERHSLVIEHALRPLFAHLRALAVPTGVYAATSDFGGEGTRALEQRIARAATEVAGLVAHRDGQTPTREADAVAEVTPFAQMLARVSAIA